MRSLRRLLFEPRSAVGRGPRTILTAALGAYLAAGAPQAPAAPVAAAVGTGSAADRMPPAAQQKLARDIFKELIEINTTHEFGSTRAAEALAAHLRAAGFAPADAQVLGPRPDKGNLVARLRGSGSGKPILFLSHLDVVEARREDWSTDPFSFIERDGYFYGRGTSDVKGEVADLVANLIRLRQEKFTPARDLIVALTADEEAGGDANGVIWLLENHRHLIDAEFVINTDAGGAVLRNGQRTLNPVQTSEKVYLSFRLEVKSPGGHSSMPGRDNAIYRLAAGLTRLEQHHFPVRLNDTTRLYFKKMAERESGRMRSDMTAVTRNPPDPRAVARLAELPYYNGMMRTTCVATMLEAGHAENALPQTAVATLQCRLLPDDPPGEVRAALVAALADERIGVTPMGEAVASPASPASESILGPIEKVTAAMWPGVTVAPVMDPWSTDGIHPRRAGIPVYGVSGMFIDVDDVRAHGKDERLGVQSFYEGVEFMYRLMKVLSSQDRPGSPEASPPST